jgi:hypothetical protein
MEALIILLGIHHTGIHLTGLTGEVTGMDGMMDITVVIMEGIILLIIMIIIIQTGYITVRAGAFLLEGQMLLPQLMQVL